MPRWAPLLLVVVVVACGGGSDEPTPITSGPGAESPASAVTELASFLAEGDFQAASALAVPKQAALASLAEGATFSQVARALEEGDAAVAANFWSGFAQGVGEVIPAGVEVVNRGTVSQSGVEFSLVGVTPASGSERLVATREVDGYRVDLFASFAAGIAGRMLSPVEVMLSSTTDDAVLILGELQEIVPSLEVAASDQSLTPEAAQEILQLIELITRVG